MRVKTIWHYFFPKPRRYQKLPLPPIRYTSKTSVWGEVPETLKGDCHKLIWGGVAVTEADAYRLLKKYPDWNLKAIIRKERRKRHRLHPLLKAWRRFKRAW